MHLLLLAAAPIAMDLPNFGVRGTLEHCKQSVEVGSPSPRSEWCVDRQNSMPPGGVILAYGRLVMIDQAHVSLVGGPTNALGCELCTSQANPPHASVIVRHTRGGVVEFAACDWCVQAIRRLAAATGGSAVFGMSEGATASASRQTTRPRGARPASPPVLIAELADRIRDPADGTLYFARVYGRARMDGTWEGWIEFVSVGGTVVLRTNQETTQSNREGVVYWASGLEPAYLEGAFARAERRHEFCTAT